MIERTRVAYHEAGHATVARLLGLDVHTATIVAADDALGHITHNGMADYARLIEDPTSPAAQIAFERVAMMSIAGCAAERKHLGSHEEELEGFEGALEDLHHATGLIESLLQEPDEQLLDAWMQVLDLRVDRLLTRHWDAVERVAAGLLERETLSTPELDDLIWQRAGLK